MSKIEFREMFDRHGGIFPQRYILVDGKSVGYVETVNWGIALIKRLSEDQVEMIKKGIEEQLNGSSKTVAHPPELNNQEEDEDEYEEFA